MAGIPVEAGSAMAQTIQSAVQPKLIENGWVAEENDTTLSEYVTMMIVNGKDVDGVRSELGGDLLGVGDDDPAVGEFAVWLFEHLRGINAPAQPQQQPAEENVEMQREQPSEAQPIPSAMDSQMDDAAPPADGVPSGPKAMRNGNTQRGRGRGSRMLGQLNNHMGRDQGLPDSLSRIRGAAGGQHGRINSHANRDTPRGPRGSHAANGVQRMMNGGGRGGHMAQGQMNPMMQGLNQLDSNQQMAFMQMMEMQANMMNQMLQQQGGGPNLGQQNGGSHGKSLFERTGNKRKSHQNGASQNGDSASMDLDSALSDTKKGGDPFDTTCRFNVSCTNPSCPYAHQSPAASPGQPIDITDTCSFGAACENRKCTGRHPSPAQRSQHLKQEVDCKFFPNCTNPSCPFKHPDMPLCRNGADCRVEGCKFTHSKISCRYNPCTKPFCQFKHAEGQRGVFKDKVWTSGEDGPAGDQNGVQQSGEHDGVANRFAEFQQNDGQAEELIIPGQQSQPEDASSSSQAQITTQITT